MFGYNLETSSASATLKNSQTVSGKKLDLEGNWKQEVRRARARCRATPRAARRGGSPDAPARSAGPDDAPRAAASRRVSFASASACADDAQCPHGFIAASRAQNNAIKLSASHKVDSNTKVSLRCAPGAQRCTRAAARRAFPGDRCRKPWLHPSIHTPLTHACPPARPARSYNLETSAAVASAEIKMDQSTIKPEVTLTDLSQWNVKLSHKLSSEDTLEAFVNQDVKPTLSYTRKQNDFELKLSAPVSKDISADASLKLTRTFEL